MSEVDKRFAPAAERNKQVILDVLAVRLQAPPLILEVASGTGQHVAHFAAHMPTTTWLPTDVDAEALPGIDRWTSELANVRRARRLDVTEAGWAERAWYSEVSAIYCANMIHIAPWAAAQGLLAGAGQLLSKYERLYLYGPFRFSGAFTAPSNAAFDQSLRARDASWGVRDVSDLKRLATKAGLELTDTVEMPANNHILEFTRL